LLDASHGHAQVLALDDHHARLAGAEVLDEGVGDLRGEPLLDLRTLGEHVDEPGELAQPGDLARPWLGM
jgi:hypothetical protein